MGQPISGPSERDAAVVKPAPDAISTDGVGAISDRVAARPRWRFPEERGEQLIQALSRAAGPIAFFAALGGLIWIALRLY